MPVKAHLYYKGLVLFAVEVNKLYHLRGFWKLNINYLKPLFIQKHLFGLGMSHRKNSVLDNYR